MKRSIYIKQEGGPFSVMAFVVSGGKNDCIRIDNLGPFKRAEAIKLARWIQEVFTVRLEKRK